MGASGQSRQWPGAWGNRECGGCKEGRQQLESCMCCSGIGQSRHLRSYMLPGTGDLPPATQPRSRSCQNQRSCLHTPIATLKKSHDPKPLQAQAAAAAHALTWLVPSAAMTCTAYFSGHTFKMRTTAPVSYLPGKGGQRHRQ